MCSLSITSKWYSLHSTSSLMSPQSFQPSHFSASLMQLLFLHRNLSGQAVNGMVNMRNTVLMSRNTHYLKETKLLTILDVSGLILCGKAVVHARLIRIKHHSHFVGAAGFCHWPIRFFSTPSEKMKCTSNDTPALFWHSHFFKAQQGLTSFRWPPHSPCHSLCFSSPAGTRVTFWIRASLPSQQGPSWQ